MFSKHVYATTFVARYKFKVKTHFQFVQLVAVALLCDHGH